MDDTLERELRESLRRHAQSAPTGYHMLADVRRDSGRRQRQRRALLGGGLAALAVAGTLGGLRLWPAGPQPAGPVPAVVSFGPGGTVLPDAFPFTPHVPLVGDRAPEFNIVGGQPTLAYQSTGAPDVWVVLRASPTRLPAVPAGQSDQAVTVRGHSGLTLLDPSVPDRPQRLVRWAERDLWLELQAPASIRLADLLSYADRLTDQPYRQPAPFTFDRTPDGFSVDNLSVAAVSFCPPGVAPSAGFEDKLTVLLGTVADTPTAGRAVRVGGRAGWLESADALRRLVYDAGTGLRLTIQLPATIPVTESDLLAFAAGVHLTPAARPGAG